MAFDFESITAAIAADSERSFAAWDQDLFTDCGGSFQHYFRWQFRDDPELPQIWRAYMTLIAQGIGVGHLRRGEGQNPSSAFTRQNLLGFCLARAVPSQLAKVPRGERLSTLATLWNLCEGLLGEPEWVQRYTLSRAAEISKRELSDVEVLLYDALDSAYAPATPATWTGALSLSCLNVRDDIEDFLPGEMYLAAPRVLCVADRRDPEVHTAVFLTPNGCRLMGPTGRLAPHEPAADLPKITLTPHTLRLGEQTLELPEVARPYTYAASPGGFVVLSAVDSQRLWVVRSP